MGMSSLVTMIAVIPLNVKTDKSTKVDKSKYNNSWYNPGSKIKRVAWYYVNCMILNSYWLPVSSVKVKLLRIFGAKVGVNVTIKPGVSIKYPWFLTLGDYVGIGEGTTIDNLGAVTIGQQSTISQGCYLVTGNHDYSSPSFELLIQPIDIEEGVWVGAFSVVCPGTRCSSQCVVSAGSVVSGHLEKNSIYRGNPAVKMGERKISQ